MSEKDPYLSELDDMDSFDETAPESSPEDEEATRVDQETVVRKQDDLDESPADDMSAHVMEGADTGGKVDILNLAPDIPVQVVAVMGRKNVTVKDLVGLRMGQVIELEKIPTDPVDLVAGGKLIAKAELVDVDGRLGLRILKLLK